MLRRNPPKDTPAPNKSYERFNDCFVRGRQILLQAVDLDERFNSDDKKLQACEMYRSALELLKEASSMNTMDIAADKRREVGDAKEKIKGYEISAKERFVKLLKSIEEKRGAGNSETRDTSRDRQPRRVQPARLNGAKIANTVTCPPTTSAGSSSITPAYRAKLLKGVDTKIGERLLDEILDKTDVRLDDVAGCQSAKSALEETVILPSLNPGLFSGLRQPVRGILLFGPPGNGKTMLAKAIASESKQLFFNMSASNLTSKWVGEGEKTIRALFQIARNAQPTIIFIDEVDSILCERSEKEHDAMRRIKTEFLVQMDGAMSSDTDRILVVGATNRPQELDDAVLRRFPKRIMIPLPDKQARFAILKMILKKHDMAEGLSDYDCRYIADRTDGYSNSDLVALCREAAMVPVRNIDRKQLSSIDHRKLRLIRRSDFEESLGVIKPSTNKKILDAMTAFAQNSAQCQ